jgi:hypothetical protein
MVTCREATRQLLMEIGSDKASELPAADETGKKQDKEAKKSKKKRAFGRTNSKAN